MGAASFLPFRGALPSIPLSFRASVNPLKRALPSIPLTFRASVNSLKLKGIDGRALFSPSSALSSDPLQRPLPELELPPDSIRLNRAVFESLSLLAWRFL